MIEIRLNNIVTIAICGALGYALVIGLSKLFGGKLAAFGVMPGMSAPNAS